MTSNPLIVCKVPLPSLATILGVYVFNEHSPFTHCKIGQYIYELNIRTDFKPGHIGLNANIRKINKLALDDKIQIEYINLEYYTRLDVIDKLYLSVISTNKMFHKEITSDIIINDATASLELKIISLNQTIVQKYNKIIYTLKHVHQVSENNTTLDIFDKTKTKIIIIDEELLTTIKSKSNINANDIEVHQMLFSDMYTSLDIKFITKYSQLNINNMFNLKYTKSFTINIFH